MEISTAISLNKQLKLPLHLCNHSTNQPLNKSIKTKKVRLQSKYYYVDSF